MCIGVCSDSCQHYQYTSNGIILSTDTVLHSSQSALIVLLIMHCFLILCVDTPLLTVAVLLEELQEVHDWYMLGAYLNVPVYQLNKIQTTHTQDGVERCKLEMLQYWLDTTTTTRSWKEIARALEQLNMLTLAARLKSKYLWTSLLATTPDSVCVCGLIWWVHVYMHACVRA